MINGCAYDLVCEYFDSPCKFSLRNYLSITRSDIVDFLKSHPDESKAAYEKYKLSMVLHDGDKIGKDVLGYYVASMDHGIARNIRRFKDMEDALAELILVSYGMY